MPIWLELYSRFVTYHIGASGYQIRITYVHPRWVENHDTLSLYYRFRKYRSIGYIIDHVVVIADLVYFYRSGYMLQRNILQIMLHLQYKQ